MRCRPVKALHRTRTGDPFLTMTVARHGRPRKTAKRLWRKVAETRVLHVSMYACGSHAIPTEVDDLDAAREVAWQLETGSCDPQGPPAGWHPRRARCIP